MTEKQRPPDLPNLPEEQRPHTLPLGGVTPSNVDTTFRSKWNYEFDVTADRWQLNAQFAVYTSDIREAMSTELAHGAIQTLAYFAMNNEPIYVNSLISSIRMFVRFSSQNGKLDKITEAMMINYRESERRNSGYEAILSGRLRPFLNKWFDLGYAGVSKNLIREMNSWILTHPPAGAVVDSMDPDKGPFTDNVFLAIQAGWRTVFERKEISLHDYVFCWLLSITGRRDVQLSWIKVKDLEDSRKDDLPEGDSGPPRKLLLLHIPRCKQKGYRWRELFRPVPVTKDFWGYLVFQRTDVIKEFKKLIEDLDVPLLNHEEKFVLENLPMFPSWHHIHESIEEIRGLLRKGTRGKAVARLMDLVSSDFWHIRRTAYYKLVLRACKAANAKNQNGEDLKVTFYRFRYTRGTNLARMGVPPRVISWMLDHSSTESAKIYQRNEPDRAIPLSKAMAKALAPLSNAFRGTVVDKEIDAPGGDNPEASRVFVGGEPGATCGILKNCGLSRLPRCCYTCNRFYPWLDGPHEAVLDGLLAERQERFDCLDANKEMVEVDDVTIKAVAMTIVLCDLRRQELAGSVHA